ncbi:MAG: hypothetical protein R2755_03410 [Acidimicrobiales bacterium]
MVNSEHFNGRGFFEAVRPAAFPPDAAPVPLPGSTSAATAPSARRWDPPPPRRARRRAKGRSAALAQHRP